ncbi:MAG: hypothetical protein GKR95_19620 [Gammaproteobacteria bacterium]|nr:hypothetical protein [Gammaproteobacteria bacterium]NKB64223.1 hypothetical protein [Gammaproteobacteria bacterium]
MTVLLNELAPIKKAIIVDIAPMPYSHDHFELLGAMKSVPIQTAKSRNEVDQLLSARIEDTALRTFLIQNAVRDENGYRWRINIESIQQNMNKLLGFDVQRRKSTVPTLFLGGAKSDYLLPEYHSNIRSAFPGAGIEMIANAGHWLHAERPSELLRCVTRFLDSE